MGHDHKSLSETISQVKKELMQFFLIMGIQASGRFIGQDNCRLIDQCTGYSYPLFLSAGEFIRFMRCPFLQSHKIKNLHSTHRSFLRRHSGYKCRNHYIFKCRELR